MMRRRMKKTDTPNMMDAAADASMRVTLLVALRASGWNLTRTAEALGLTQPSEVRRYIVRLGLVEELEAAKAAGLASPGSRSPKPAKSPG